MLLLGACSTPAAKPIATAPAVVAEAEANQPVGTRMPDGDDLCKAADLQWLVGKNKREIPVPVDVVNRRVVCSSCAVTMDYSPYRQNIFFNAQTDIVESVRCG
ncbi:MAG: hypothetical protein JWR59_1419 [Brevundimonas sp.]|nr:hypothetical protein [Brevundimonas sp.]